MNISVILIDMDGVLANWSGGVCRAFELDEDAVYSSWHKGNSHIETAIGISREEISVKLNKAGKDFWANLDIYPWANELFDHCRSVAPTCVLSDPGRFNEAVIGKIEWLQKHLSRYNTRGRGFEDFLLGPNKSFAAHKNAVLIDDNEDKVNAFRKAGGNAILFPAIWNKNFKYANDPFQYTVIALEQIKDN